MYTPRFIRNCALVALVFSSQMAFSQSGPKWATEGNLGDAAAFVGTTNAFSLIFKTNNTQWMSLNTTGILQVNSLAGPGTGFATLDADGNLYRTSFPNDPYQVLTGNGTFSTFSSVGGWAFSGNNLYNSNTGYVGIGTNNPQYLLDVNGNARVNGTLYALGLVLATKMQADTMKSTTMISVNNNLNFNGGLLNEIYTYNGDIRMQSRIGYNGNTVLNAGTTGNVGVGIYSPQYKLDVNGDVRVSGSLRTQRIRPLPGDTVVILGDSSVWVSSSNRIFPYGPSVVYRGIAIGNQNSTAKGLNSLAIGSRVWTSATADYAIVLGSGAANWSMKNDIANSLMVGFNSNIPTLFVEQANGVGTIGKVGIGTTTPEALFQVGDGVETINMGPAPSLSPTLFSTSYIGFNTARVGINEWQTKGNGYGNGGVVLLNDFGGGFRIIGIPSIDGNDQLADDQFIEDHTKLYVRNDGRVIIGDGTMVGGPHDAATTKLSVDGTIICRELYVTQNDWADSVFYSNYYLMPLDSVANFVKVNGHLPGVPSQQDVITNGSNLGKNDVILLAKIEELTIYMIQLQKEIEMLKKNQVIEIQTEPK